MHSMTWKAAAIALAVSGTALAGEPAPAPPPAPAAAPAPESAPAPAAPEPHELPFTISGKIFVDFSYAQNVDRGANTKAQTLGLDVKRFYVGIDYTLNEVISATFLTDIGDLQGKYDVFVKKAYIQAKLSRALVVRAGSADMPWITYAEDRYDHRYVENTFLDRTRYGNSADWGLHALGELADGRLGYQLSIVNGHGFANPTRARWPSLEARLDTTLAESLHVAVGASVSTLGATSPVPHPGTRLDALVAWDDTRVQAGFEGFLARNFTADQVSGVAPEDTARGLSVFAAYRFIPELGAFGRFDFVQPVADTDPSVKDLYLNLGLEYVPWKFLDLALVYKHETVDAGRAGFVFSTANGEIGSMTPGSSGTYQEVGLFAQLVF